MTRLARIPVRGLSLALLIGTLLSASAGEVARGASTLLVTGYDASNQNAGFVDMYSSSGTFLGHFIPEGRGGLNDPYNLRFGPDGNLYVTSPGDHTVKVYNGATGAFLRNAYSTGSLGATDLAFDSSGHLFVGMPSGRLDEINPVTGTLLRSFTGLGDNSPAAIALASDNSLLFDDAVTNQITDLNLVTGQTTPYGTALNAPRGLTLGADGRLFVSQVNDSSVYVVAPGGGSAAFFGSVGDRPYFSTFVDGNLYVASDTGTVTEFSITGQVLGTWSVVSSSGDIVPVGIVATVPEPSALGVLGAVGYAFFYGVGRRRVS